MRGGLTASFYRPYHSYFQAELLFNIDTQPIYLALIMIFKRLYLIVSLSILMVKEVSVE